jgi:hypothetical protein
MNGLKLSKHVFHSRRLLLHGMIYLILTAFLLVFSLEPVLADGGGIPTPTRTVTSTPTLTPIPPPTATPTFLPTLTLPPYPGVAQPTLLPEIIFPTSTPPPETGGGFPWGIGCVPILLLILLLVVIAVSYYFTRRARPRDEEM